MWLTFTRKLLFGRVDDFDCGLDFKVQCFELLLLSFETLADLDCLNKTTGCVFFCVVICDFIEKDGLLT